MSTPNDGGPAFPLQWLDFQPTTGDQVVREQFPGMTLRDWFAGQALASMTVAPDYSKGPCNQAMAERAYVIADAMLKARGQ